MTNLRRASGLLWAAVLGGVGLIVSSPKPVAADCISQTCVTWCYNHPTYGYLCETRCTIYNCS
jgi:hypothetical protein